jgi:hypothetical protein
MKRLHSKTRFGSCILHFAVCIGLILLSGCGSGSDTSQSTSSDTGSIAFSVVFQGAPSKSEMRQATALDCAASGVSTVEASIYDQANVLLKSGGPWTCEAHGGTINGVPAGSNYKAVILGKDSDGDILYQGEKTGITVTAGQTTHAGTVTMSYIGATLLWDVSNWDEADWG